MMLSSSSASLRNNMEIPINTSELLVYNLQCYFTDNKYPLDEPFYIIQIVMLVATGVIIIPIVVSNFIATFVFSRKNEIAKSHSVLLLSSSVCDGMTGLIGLPMTVSTLIMVLLYSKHNCIVYYIHYYLTNFLTWVSFLSTVLMAFGRHIAVSKPLLYAVYMKGKTLPYIISLIIISVVVGTLVLVSVVIRSKLPFACASMVIPPLIIYTIVVYVRALVYLKRSMKGFCVRGHMEERNRQITIQKESKDIRLTLLMLLSLCVCYLPVFVVYCITMLIGDKPSHLLITIGKTSQFFAIMKTLINPILYYSSSHAYKVYLQKYFRLNTRLTTSDVIPSTNSTYSESRC